LRKDLDQQLLVATRGAGVLKVFVAQMVKRDSVLDTGNSELIIPVWAEAKEVAASAVEGSLEVHSIPASTSGELIALHHLQQEVDQKIPMEYFLVDTEECCSENLASETHIELAGSSGLVKLHHQQSANLKKSMLAEDNVTAEQYCIS
jgi:hypothetical protein